MYILHDFTYYLFDRYWFLHSFNLPQSIDISKWTAAFVGEMRMAIRKRKKRWSDGESSQKSFFFTFFTHYVLVDIDRITITLSFLFLISIRNSPMKSALHFDMSIATISIDYKIIRFVFRYLAATRWECALRKISRCSIKIIHSLHSLWFTVVLKKISDI